uniref:Uncharacterized protein n=1 Tax=Romanomermis culicivorax TaxID=13658 RepID=A0A915I2T4_ROMCU
MRNSADTINKIVRMILAASILTKFEARAKPTWVTIVENVQNFNRTLGDLPAAASIFVAAVAVVDAAPFMFVVGEGLAIFV